MSSKALKISYRSFMQNIYNKRKKEKKGEKRMVIGETNAVQRSMFNVQG